MWMLLVLFLQTNPHTTADDVERGGNVYKIHCARCHGLTGEGGRGPNLADGDFYHGDTDADLFRIYRMPLPMKKRSLRSRPILDEIVYADAHVLERADLSEAFALET